MQLCYKYLPTALSEHKVMCTAHGPFFVRLWHVQLKGISRAVRVLRLNSMADSRTERLRVQLPVSIRPSFIARTHSYLAVVAIHRLPNEIDIILK